MSGASDLTGTLAVPVVDRSDVVTHPITEERRASKRVVTSLSIRLTGMGCEEGHGCTAADISQEGMFLCVPVEYGLFVGLRCTVSFTRRVDCDELSCLTGETCYATVIRTARRQEGGHTMIGAGLRFDQPLFF